MQSPLFNGVSPTNGYSYETRVAFTPAAPAVPATRLEDLPKDEQGRVVLQGSPGNRLSIKIERVTTTDCQPVDGIETAEDIIMNLVTPVVHEVDVPEEQLPDHYAGILIQALRYSNIIAACTRRGQGNVILMGRDVLKKVDDAYRSLGKEGYVPRTPEMVGRWEKVGTVMSSIELFTGDAIPEDEVFIAYVGAGTAIDGPGGLIYDDNGDLFLRIVSNNTSALGNASDYVRRFKVVTK